ncbi:DUF2914 domain-containing protein [Reinekea blandensis]|uniref:DUF2914 domain-containing protein n=1 Tax=Reinekea blandensis MED297 TaxID=314283 RepID=A4BEK0_9GAMM|nr:DUF2914 domain-containing protein [Reinekea blandensis]EAR09427.1 hypothetical protein MED297_02367 [Reinekea sp. MED297] [Reinekea blandensis MED297]
MKKLCLVVFALMASFVFAEPEVARHQFTTAVEDREPVDALTDAMNINPMYYFTELKGFEGTVVTHRWMYNGEQMANVTFNVGGPRWRVYSSKQLLPEWDGDWTVEVVDEQGQVVASDTVSIMIE